MSIKNQKILNLGLFNLGGMSAFFRAYFLKGGHFVCLHSLYRHHFYPFLMKIFFSKLSAIVAPNKGLE